MHRVILLSVLFIAILSGCAALHTFPSVARAGDTVVLAVGSVDGLKKDNISIIYFADSDPATQFDLSSNVRSVIRLYPDQTSPVALGTNDPLSSAGGVPALAGHGPWLNTVVLDLPTNLPAGPGHFIITFGAGVTKPNVLATAEDVYIAMEILTAADGSAETGAPHVFDYAPYQGATVTGNVSGLSQARQVVVRPMQSGSYGGATVGAAEFILDVPIVDDADLDVTNLITDDAIQVVLDKQQSYVENQVSLIWKRSGSTITVYVTSPSPDGISLQKVFIRFSIIAKDNVTDAVAGAHVSDSAYLTSVRYFDINGNLMSGPGGTLVHEAVIQGEGTVPY